MGTQLDSHTARTRPGALAGQPPLLHGRAAEQAVIDRLIATARAGSSGALVVRGEAGIGKTALLDYAASAAAAVPHPHAPAMRVIRALGSEAESGLPFAGLHLLLRPVLDRLPALPRPQQDALRGALGLGSAVATDRFLAGLALLSLLTELADERPLLCLVDDAHWLDRDSAGALMFAARRLHAEGVAVIFAARGPARLFAAPGLPELPLSGLDEAAASALLMEHGGAVLAPGIRHRILAGASGNALGLIELPAAYLAGPAPAPRQDGPPPKPRPRSGTSAAPVPWVPARPGRTPIRLPGRGGPPCGPGPTSGRAGSRPHSGFSWTGLPRSPGRIRCKPPGC